MPATATARATAAGARRAAARTAPAPRARARTVSRARPAPRPAPRAAVAVGRIPVAVGGIADSPVVLRLTRSRLWIGLLACLLVGIVALNVLALSFNAASSKTAGLSDQLKRENSALRAQLAGELSNEQLQRAASTLGLIVPEPGAILYLRPGGGDAAAAAERIASGDIALGAVSADPPAITPAVVDPATTTSTVAPVDPAVAPAPTAAAPEPAVATTATPTTGVPVASGGAVISP